ncbi:RNA pyrophosphohydrolase [Aurantiacibacter aquimixticola]|uniref:RNA pyrophosphohydrolase n=1 Tax=Aurantiacibacter aquimixticola TaxID=1958945 RepID=A0A419RSJ2_9SPHN|nr:RNA pyrophosphohydrolase [Aurantiacibacter aquimixticola]RJY08750.1 RNA pyrophosphohydrolase [Aurantiacibacter aquimixticola]
MTREDHLQYRPCVGTMLVNADGEAFVGKRIDNKEGDWWQMPQGGVDDGEDLDEAMLRELGEETGIAGKHLQIIHRMQNEVYYDLPPELQGKLWGGKYKGQRQHWYLVRFTGDDSDIDLDAHKHPEFCEWKWVAPSLLPELIVPFKREIYERIVSAFAPLISAGTSR